MSLVTVLRSPSSENASICTDSELDEDVEDGPSPRSRTSSIEGFFTSKGSAFALPDGDFARKASKHGGEMQTHLQSMVNLLRDDDVLRLVVKLEAKTPEKVRYLTVVSAFNEDDIEESIAMGVDWMDSKSGGTIGLVLPLLRDTTIEFDGDGGFCLCTNHRRHIIKPVSVQTMWTAVQWIHRCGENARKNNHFPNGQSHQWISYYSSRISSDQSCINEWFEMEDVSSFLPVLPIGTTPEQELMMKLIRHKLREVMMKVDLEEVTSRQIRQNLEEEMQMELKEYKQFIDEEMLTILGQLDSSSQIYDHVYLGSEWNASNLEELKENGIGYILNISREIDNFFSGTFEYLNVRIYDEEESELLPFWEKTYKFINEAKINGSKVLVHCKMGMSRSASTVIAYGMKEFGTSLHDTMKFVKSKRACVNPNAGFWKQLITYEGILNSSNQRYNELFTSGRRRTNSADLEGRKSVKRRRRRRQNKSKTLTLGSNIEPKVVIDSALASTLKSVFDDEESDQDTDEKSTPSSGSCEPSDEVLKSWEEKNVFSNPSSPNSSHSRPESPDLGKDELDDQVGGLVPTGKGNVQKSPTLHRAHSVPSLVGDASKSSEDVSGSEKTEALHRCNSLMEFLSGKVAAIKEDYKAQTLGKHSGSALGSIEKKQTKKPEETTEDVIVEKKTKLHSTLSDPTGSSSTGGLIGKSEQESMEAEKVDVGSSPDQSHGVVHRDADDVVKSGTVKRQSRNFEEGKVNLPWDWEEAMMELSAREDAQSQDVEPTVPEPELTVTQDEPPSGLVKMHAQKFQRNFSQETKSSGSEGEEGNDSKLLSPDREKRAEQLFPSGTPKKVVVLDANSIPVEPESKEKTESERIREEMQKAKKLFEQDVKKVNEDMLQEKLKRRSQVKRKSTEEEVKIRYESQDNTEPIVTDENQESSEVCEEVQDEDEDESEDPRPGTVLKHLQAIKHKYGTTVSTKSGAAESEEDSPKKAQKIEQESPGGSKKMYVIQESEDKESPGKSEALSNEKDSIDVDVLLRRVNEDMRKEREQRRGVGSDFKVLNTSSDEDSSKDVQPEDENTESLKEKDDSETNEIPRPGIVKRSTDLLLGKARLDDMTEEETANLDEEGGSSIEEPVATVEQSSEVQEVDRDNASVAESDIGEKGLVKRHTLVYEGKLPQTEEGEPSERDTTSEIPIENPPSLETEDGNMEDKKAVDETVDSSAFVSVKLRLKLMEEVIQKANERECHKQRTRSALAELENKRELIESEQIKRQSESATKEREEIMSASSEDDDNKSISMEKEKKTFLIASDEDQENTGHKATENITEMTTDDQNTDESPCVGNVRLRTMLLEERIHSSTEDLSKSKPGTSIRRHESMPRTTRPVDRPIVRQRSLSDLNTDKPSTSSGLATSTNRWSLDLRRDKNKIAKFLGSQDEELPDNDRNSEKFSDDMSEKSDKTDDCLSKPSVDIFELSDKDLELSKEGIQITDLDNKDIPSL